MTPCLDTTRSPPAKPPKRTLFARISFAEYDPLEPNRRAIKARVGRLRDPCRRVLDKRAEENSLLSDEGELC